MPTGTPITMGFYASTEGIPCIDERSFNEGVPYADEAEVLSLLPITSRARYLMVNIAGVEYEFSEADLTTLTVKGVATANTADNITIDDTGGYYDSTDVEGALQEAGADIAAVVADVALLTTIPPYTINLPAAANLAAKVAAAVETTDYPTGWTLAVTDTVNLTITHGLAKEIDHVTVKKVVGAAKTILRPYSTAYSEITATTTSILVIEGIDPSATQTIIHLTFVP